MREWASKHRWEAILGVILLVTIAVNAILSPFYLGVGNFINLFWLSNEKILLAVVMAFVIINGEIDLSVASVMGLSAAVLASLHANDAVPFEVAILIALATGASAGLFQGLVVTRFGLPSLVVTLAGLIGFRGAARVLLEDRSVGGFPGWFNRLGQQTLIGPFPLALLIFVTVLAVGWIVLERSVFGRKVYVVGNNAEVARYSGIAVGRLKRRLFVASGLLSALAGILFSARLGSVRGSLAEFFELDIITMVLLGGVSIFGGSGSMLGVVLGLFIILNIRNGLGLANVDGIIQSGVIGLLLIGSVLVPNLAQRVRSSSARLGAAAGRAPPDERTRREVLTTTTPEEASKRPENTKEEGL